VRYLLSFGSLQQDGNFNGNTMLYKQYNARVKVDIELVKNLIVGANINGIFKDGDYPGGNSTGDPNTSGNINFYNILGANPTIVGVYPNGLLGPGRLGQSALLNDQRGYFRNNSNPIYSTFTASYAVPFVRGLSLMLPSTMILPASLVRTGRSPTIIMNIIQSQVNMIKSREPAWQMPS
jgi:hypothetical protein